MFHRKIDRLTDRMADWVTDQLVDILVWDVIPLPLIFRAEVSAPYRKLKYQYAKEQLQRNFSQASVFREKNRSTNEIISFSNNQISF